MAGAIVRARRSTLSSITVESLLIAMENDSVLNFFTFKGCLDGHVNKLCNGCLIFYITDW